MIDVYTLETRLQASFAGPALERMRTTVLAANGAGAVDQQVQATLYRVLTSELKSVFVPRLTLPYGYLTTLTATLKPINTSGAEVQAGASYVPDALKELESLGVAEEYLALLRSFLDDASPQAKVAGASAVITMGAIVSL